MGIINNLTTLLDGLDDPLGLLDDFPMLVSPTFSWPTVSSIEGSIFEFFDANIDGVIAFSEVVATLDPQGQSLDLPQFVQQMLATIDSNADQKLSLPEVHAVIGKLDTNGDGVLSPADLLKALIDSSQQPVSAAMVTLALNGLPPGSATPASRGQALTTVVDTLFTRFDANKSSSLSLGEFTAVLDPQHRQQQVDDALAALVTQVDSNRDGQMSRAEVAAAVATLDADHNGTLDARDHLPAAPGDGSVDLIGLLMPQLREASFSGH